MRVLPWAAVTTVTATRLTSRFFSRAVFDGPDVSLSHRCSVRGPQPTTALTDRASLFSGLLPGYTSSHGGRGG